MFAKRIFEKVRRVDEVTDLGSFEALDSLQTLKIDSKLQEQGKIYSSGG